MRWKSDQDIAPTIVTVLSAAAVTNFEKNFMNKQAVDYGAITNLYDIMIKEKKEN